MTTSDLCDLFQVSHEAIRLWTKKGMPKLSRGTFDLRAVFPWWLENINSGPEDRDESIVAAKNRYWAAKADKEISGEHSKTA